jgi:hypothetical protein
MQGVKNYWQRKIRLKQLIDNHLKPLLDKFKWMPQDQGVLNGIKKVTVDFLIANNESYFPCDVIIDYEVRNINGKNTEVIKEIKVLIVDKY